MPLWPIERDDTSGPVDREIGNFLSALEIGPTDMSHGCNRWGTRRELLAMRPFMRTETLTAILASNLEPAVPSRKGRRYALGILVGGLVALLLMGGILKVNPALAHEVTLPAFWVRELYCGGLGVLSVCVLARLALPGERLGLWPAGIALIVLLMWILGAVVLLSAGPQSRVHLLLGTTARVCPFLIAFLAAPLFAALVWILKGLAPTRLRLAGATAGFAAGSLGSVVYALHCPELAPPFIAT